MSSGGSHELAGLWRDHGGPEELADLSWMATKIKRNAAWKWELDLALTMLAGMACAIVLIHRGPPLAGLWIFLISPAILWYVWKRRQITDSWRALAIGQPPLFFAAALRNVRAEIRLSSIALISAALFLATIGAIGAASVGLDHVAASLRGTFARTPLKIVFGIVTFGIFAYFVRTISACGNGRAGWRRCVSNGKRSSRAAILAGTSRTKTAFRLLAVDLDRRAASDESSGRHGTSHNGRR